MPKIETCPNCGSAGSRSPLAEIHKPDKFFCTACNFIKVNALGYSVFLCRHCGEGTFTDANPLCTKCGKSDKVYDAKHARDPQLKARLENRAKGRAELLALIADAESKGQNVRTKKLKAALSLCGIHAELHPRCFREPEEVLEEVCNAFIAALTVRWEDNGNICADAVRDMCVEVLARAQGQSMQEIGALVDARAANIEEPLKWEGE